MNIYKVDINLGLVFKSVNKYQYIIIPINKFKVSKYDKIIYINEIGGQKWVDMLKIID